LFRDDHRGDPRHDLRSALFEQTPILVLEFVCWRDLLTIERSPIRGSQNGGYGM